MRRLIMVTLFVACSGTAWAKNPHVPHCKEVKGKMEGCAFTAPCGADNLYCLDCPVDSNIGKGNVHFVGDNNNNIWNPDGTNTGFYWGGVDYFQFGSKGELVSSEMGSFNADAGTEAALLILQGGTGSFAGASGTIYITGGPDVFPMSGQLCTE